MMVHKKKNRAIFFDRDGVINKDSGYTHVFKEEDIIKECVDVIKYVNKIGYLCIIITNQSGIGRGLYSERIFHLYMSQLQIYLNTKGVKFNNYFFAPYYKFSAEKKYRKGENYRKPNIGMFSEAVQKYNIDTDKSIMVGDKITDIQSAQSVGLKNIVLYNENLPHKIVHNSYWMVNNLQNMLKLPIW
jgi:D-glycero-D-manno-heptose 1,7-bisphosphate phosphatase